MCKPQDPLSQKYANKSRHIGPSVLVILSDREGSFNGNIFLFLAVKLLRRAQNDKKCNIIKTKIETGLCSVSNFF